MCRRNPSPGARRWFITPESNLALGPMSPTHAPFTSSWHACTETLSHTRWTLRTSMA